MTIPVHSRPDRQRGVAIVLFTIALAAIIGISGMALDLGHGYHNRTLLQNALDAAALSGAKIVNDGGSVASADASARATFDMHASGELGTAAELGLVVEFSETLMPFTPGAVEPDADFVRARVDNFPTTIFLARVLPGVGDSMAVAGSAVAGPSPPLGTGPDGEICDIAPIMACGAPGDTDCSDGACYGYEVGTEVEQTLKTSSGSGGNFEVGPGNFQLIELECGSGGACVRQELAGGFSSCLATDEPATTKPGNNVGPVSQGFNTRFGIYQGPVSASEYPPDAVTFHDPAFWYDDYEDRLDNGPYDFTPVDQGGTGVPMRRVLAVPIGDCTGTTNGHGEVDILGLGCFYMTRPTSHAGNTQEIYGQFIESCQAAGGVAEDPEPSAATLFKIILYKDPDRVDT